MDKLGKHPTEDTEMPSIFRRGARTRRRLFTAWLPVLTLLAAGLVLAGCGQSAPGAVDQIIEDIVSQAAFDMIQQEANNPNFTLLDLRTPEEIAEGYIEGADNIDFYDEDFREQLDQLDKNRKYVIYCRSGGRSGKTRDIMRELGFTEVYNALGGIIEWRAVGLPVVVP